jgi:formylglycine-generating enzyme required for sulfatase activity
MAYCSWLGKLLNMDVTLPTEAQWECAASGGSRGYRYPWGNEFHSRYITTNTEREAAPVNSHPKGASPYGCYNMLGNALMEWCLDYYDASYYTKSAKHNPKGPQWGSIHSVKGYTQAYNPAFAFRNSVRTYHLFPNRVTGFRVAIDLR